jgi:hypothetical protein
VSRSAWNLPAVVGLLALCLALPAHPQGNIDAGKTPAQIFSSTCSACHRRPQELKRTSVGFMRQHYTTGTEEATAMASYLAGVGSDPRAVKDRGKTPQQPQDRSKAAQGQPQDKAAQAQAQVKGRKTAETAKALPSARQSDPLPETAVPEPVAAAPALEPFDE